ncbi:hypothetical protein CANARDRAFT_21570 [[Candida] arabinofermentans NRRL YB-2248]|uniref:Uncharacterized protein n=1 Tax=[Candida] arabinofermentans NRRL YB-2248 TaxID=983967 RepID=A0A1E4T784_9ASCO|nr:hypothetical protein CANARDRAFT_21570 [[Candida] arabinofermentans NRRL YB-2248]
MFSSSITFTYFSLLCLMSLTWSYEFSDFNLLATWDNDYELKVPTNITVYFDVLSDTIKASLGDMSELKCDKTGAERRVVDHVLSDLLENFHYKEIRQSENDKGQKITSYIGAAKKSSSNPLWYEDGWSLASNVGLFVGDMIDYSLHYLGLIRSKCPSTIYVVNGVLIHIDRYTLGSNCDISTIDSLVGIITKSIEEAEERSLVGWCISLDHSGSHTSEIKFMNQTAAAAISFSEIICPSKAEIIRDEL